MAKFYTPNYSLVGASGNARDRAARDVLNWCVEGPLSEGFCSNGGTCLVVTGTSGLVLGMNTILDGLPILYVRREEEARTCHGSRVQALTRAGAGAEFHRYVFLDDCIETGATLRRVRQALDADMRLLAALLYGAPSSWLDGHPRPPCTLTAGLLDGEYSPVGFYHL